MKNKYLIFGLMLLLCMAMATAFTTTVSSPTASSTPGGNTLFNVSVSGHGVLTNCSMTVTSSATANTSVAIFTEQVNDSGATDFVNYTYNTNNLEDGAYSVTGTCWNSTDDSTTSSAVSFSVDNGVPTTPSSLTTTKQTSGTFSLTATVDNPSTTGCSVNWLGTSPPTSSASYSASTCTVTVTNAPDFNYRYQVTATDGLNTSTSSEAGFQVETSRGGGGSSIVTTTTSPADKIAEGTTQAVSKTRNIFQKIIDFIKNLFS